MLGLAMTYRRGIRTSLVVDNHKLLPRSTRQLFFICSKTFFQLHLGIPGYVWSFKLTRLKQRLHFLQDCRHLLAVMINTVAPDNAVLHAIQFLDIDLKGGAFRSRTNSDNYM